MDEQLKQRLVGAAVIISLAIIFLPMLLDGGRYTEYEKIRIEIPQRPGVDFSSSIKPLAPPQLKRPSPPDIAPPATVELIDTEGQAPVIDSELAEIIRPIEAPEKVVSKQGVDVRKLTVAKKAEVKPPVAVKKSLSTPSKKPVVMPLPLPTAVTAWVVQVGSFSSRQSAIDLRNKLRKKGFAAFVESFDKDGKPSHRVRIGPEASRSRADKTLASLRSKMKTAGIVVSYP